ncbi:NAD-dependent epimerase/dehydratase family protein [Psychrobacillus sp. NPDC093180]|uniref:NAD-dependent epimerase/dehydratase family protein n=1 Tax=Psychrobacillus sp. NPDC093180 TaxID=3364489 RepID=UPI003818A481
MLILGATGFLGSTLLGLATKMPNTFVKGTSRYSNEDAHIIQVDVIDIQSIEKAIKQIEPDVVVWSLMNGEKEDELTDIGLRNLLEMIEKETKLIFLSTDAIFVDGRGNYTESDQTGSLAPDAPLFTYVTAKSKAENIIQHKHLNHVIVRTGPLYGEDFNQKIEQRTKKLIKQIEIGEQPKAYVNVYKTFVHVEDLAKAILEISSKQFTGILHIGPMQKESYYSFFKKRLSQLGYENSLVQPYLIEDGQMPHLALDTSLNTEKARTLLETAFREV